jgi:hypothetical protein
MTTPITHNVNLSAQHAPNHAYAARMLVSDGASPDDIIQIWQHGRLIRSAFIWSVLRKVRSDGLPAVTGEAAE